MPCFKKAIFKAASLYLLCLQFRFEVVTSDAEEEPTHPQREKPKNTASPWLDTSILLGTHWFPNFDCIGVPEADEVYRVVKAIPESVKEQCSTGWVSHTKSASNEVMWQRYTEYLQNVSSPLFKAACPFGDITARMAKWVTCHLGAAHPACENSKVWFGSELIGVADEMQLPLSIVFITFENSQWAWLWHDLWSVSRQAADHGILRVEADMIHMARQFDQCQSTGEDTGWPWASMQQELRESETGMVMLEEGFNDWDMKLQECPMGSLVIVLGQLFVLSTSLSEEVEGLAGRLLPALAVAESLMNHLTGGRLEPMLLMAYTSWDVATMWAVVTLRLQWKEGGKYTSHYQHKPFRLDFWQAELVKPDREDLLYRVSLSAEGMQQALTQDLRKAQQSPALRSITSALWTVQHMTNEEAGPNRLVLLAMVFSDRIARFMPGYLARAEGFDLLRKFIFSCQDEASLGICTQKHKYPALCVAGNIPSTSSKYTAMTAILQAGFGVLYLDFDVILMQDPIPYVLKRAEQAEIVVSRDFGSECINTGVTYVKPHPESVDFMERLLIWLWHHPYEFCQKAVAGLLGVEDLTLHEFYRRPYLSIPRWKMLDHVNQFVTSTIYDKKAQGWTGELENIVIYHFLDGLGTVSEDVAVGGRYKNLNALFFDNPMLNLTDVTTPLWEQDPRVKEELEGSRQSQVTPDEELAHCTVIEYTAWPRWKKLQRAEVVENWAAAAA